MPSHERKRSSKDVAGRAERGGSPAEQGGSHIDYWRDWPRESFGRAVFLLERHRRRYYDKELAPFGLSSAHLPLLALLWEGHDGDTQSFMADELRIDAATVTRAVRRLRQLGYVRREVSARDGRAFRVELTEEGWELAKHVRDASRRFNELLSGEWSPRRRWDVLRGMQQMLVRLDEAEAAEEG